MNKEGFNCIFHFADVIIAVTKFELNLKSYGIVLGVESCLICTIFFVSY